MTQKLFLLGHPIGRSLAAAMHQAAFEALGIDARYEARDIPPDEFVDAVAALRLPDVVGSNVTMPYKSRVIDLLDEVDPEALAVGAVNTVRRVDQRLVGYNSDVAGLKAAFTQLTGGLATGPGEAVVLGAGGAARSVVYTLAMRGCQRISLFNRTANHAASLESDLRATLAPEQLSVHTWDEERISELARKTGYLVNATSVGLDSDETPLPGHLLSSGLRVMDLIYHPRETHLLRDAASQGAALTMNGEVMLLYQGVGSFEFWFDRPAPVSVMAETIQQAMAAQQ